jgi:glycosyltransferase involved in cell wall biosynthesis
MSLSFVINGRFLARTVSGVERYARQITLALDQKLSRSALDAPKVTLLAPSNTSCDLPLQSISFRSYGNVSGHLWEQTVLPVLARKSVLINLCNSGPLFHRKNFVVIHDAAVYRYPRDFSFLYRTYHRGLDTILARLATIGTVSHFSQRELFAVLGIETALIPIIGNGADHFSAMDCDSPDVTDALGVRGMPYFVTVGTASKRKNLEVVLRAVRLLDRFDFRVVVVGGRNPKVFEETKLESDPRLVFAGRITDEQLAALYKTATALVFPSRYEGFGIPPLEAFSRGCPVIAATAESVREVCGDAAEFFDPDDPQQLSSIMNERLDDHSIAARWVELGFKRAADYQWANAADCLWKKMLVLAGGGAL